MKLKYILITLCIALVTWLSLFLYSLDWKKHEVEVGFHSDVSKDSFTMAQRLLTKHGVQWHKIKHLDDNEQDSLLSKKKQILILDEAALNRSHGLDEQLAQWVSDGGYLVYILNKQRDELGLNNTAFFQNLGITIKTKENIFENYFVVAEQRTKNTTLTVHNNVQLDLELSRAFDIKDCPGKETKNNDDQVVMCDSSFGNGRIIIMPSMSPFINYQLRHLDHGSFLIWLTQGYETINYIPYLSYPNWFAKLWHWGWQWVISLVVLVILFIWHVSSRVGRAYAPDSMRSVSFEHHIRAVANYYTRYGFEQRLFTALKKDFHMKAESRIPNFNLLSQSQQVEVIAKLTKLDKQQVADLINMQTPKSDQQRTDYIKLYKQLRNAL